MDSHKRWHDDYEGYICKQNSLVQDIADSPPADGNIGIFESESSNQDVSASSIPVEPPAENIIPLGRTPSVRNSDGPLSPYPRSEGTNSITPLKWLASNSSNGKERENHSLSSFYRSDQGNPNGDVSTIFKTTEIVVLLTRQNKGNPCRNL
jgi:hypothetical protein